MKKHLLIVLLFLNSPVWAQVSGPYQYTLQVDGSSLLKSAAGNKIEDQNFIQAFQEAEQLSKSSTNDSTNIIRLFATCYSRNTKNPLYTILVMFTKVDDATIIRALETEYEKQIEQVADILSKRLLYYSGKAPRVLILGRSGKIRIETEDQPDKKNLNLLLTNNGVFRFAKVLEQRNVYTLYEKLDSVCVQNNIGPISELMEKPHSALYTMISSTSNDDICYLNKNRDIINEILQHKKIRALYSPVIEYHWEERKKDRYLNEPAGVLTFCYTEAYPKEFCCLSVSPVDSAYLQRASYDTTQTELYFKFNAKDAERFSEYTETLSSQRSRAAFFIGDYLFFAPVVQSKIPGGRCTISGVLNETELMQIICVLIRCDAYPTKVLLLNP